MRYSLILTLLWSLGVYAAGVASKDITVSTNGDLLQFDKTDLTVSPRQSLHVIVKNAASKNSGLQHNWVLIKPGRGEQVAADSIKAGVDKGWLAPSDDVLAHTRLLNPGEEETLSLKAPSEKGDYPYICSFPGHSTTMKGILHVR